MNNIARARIAATGAVLAAGLLLTACSSSDDSTPAASSNAPASSNATATQATPGAGNASGAQVDGKAFDAHFTTTCAKQGDLLALALADTGNATYGNLAVSATLNGSDAVQAVGIAGSKGGSNGLPYALGFGKGLPGGSATAKKDGNTYTITGEGVGAPDMSNPTAPNSEKFQITFACSTVVGS